MMSAVILVVLAGLVASGLIGLARACWDSGWRLAARVTGVLAAACGMLVLVGILDAVRAHDWYSEKKTSGGGSCCNGITMPDGRRTGDCQPVRAWTDDAGRWHLLYVDGLEYDVPEDAIHDDSENVEPFQASACVWNRKVICFWRKRAGG